MTGRFNRLALDENLPSQASKDVTTGKSPVVTLAAPYTLQVAHIVDETVTSIADWASVRLQVTSQCNKNGDRYLDQTVTSLNPSLTQSAWEAGTDQHAVFTFNDNDTNLALAPCDNGPLYYVLTATLLNGQIVPLGNGLLSVDRQYQTGTNLVLAKQTDNFPQLALTASYTLGPLGATVTPNGPNSFNFNFSLPVTSQGILFGNTAGTIAVGNDNRFPITLAAAPSRGLEVWIAPDRTDGLPGKGTYEDPFDGSTRAKFEVLLNALPASITIHLLPGTFHTLGSTGAAFLQEGWKIIGAGLNKTTIIIDPLANASAQLLNFFKESSVLNYLQLSELTLDGNIANQPNGLIIGGATQNVTGGFRYVHLKNWGSTPSVTNVEAFGLVISADSGLNANACNIEITNCVVDPPLGNSSSQLGINYGNPNQPNRFASGRISDNVVTGGNYSGAGIALGGQFSGLEVSRNVVRHCGRGFHQDTVSGSLTALPVSQNVDIHDNLFADCQTGIGLSGGQGTMFNYKSHHNFIGLSGVSFSTYGAGNGFFFGGGITSFQSDHDRVYAETGVTTPGNLFGFDNTQGNNRVAFSDLTVGTIIQPPGSFDTTKNQVTASRNNRYDDGSVVQMLPDTNASLVFSNVQGTPTPAGRRRLVYYLCVSDQYVYGSPQYLIRISNNSGQECVFLFSVNKPYQGGRIENVQILTNSTGANLVGTTTNGTGAGGVPAITVKFVLSNPQNSIGDFTRITVTNLGDVSAPGLAIQGTWSDEVVGSTETAILNGTAPATYPLPGVAPVVQTFTTGYPVINGAPARFVFQAASSNTSTSLVSLPLANLYAPGAELRVVDAHGYTASPKTVTFTAASGNTLSGTATLSGAGTLIFYSDGVSAWVSH